MQSTTYQAFYAVVARIPRGKVATYGQIALLAGLPGGARSVGYALSALDAGSPVPWHRVVNAAGSVSRRRNAHGAEETQRIRLECEGVQFDARGRISLAETQWLPG